ncbi:hypothetical protein BN7_5809 [Wickerhamomyces ciferrii]|uniref:Uncharacterized protein n=1 Tax=Wickerhamomyces ciferrii (strain ATCC 14091 / BCRC 22168 / CBS 111 / JCM 3599 / NBRC 0793 / NRRL Y-1031 F-60-10) TaxID=1206466 RepID=K0KYR3_WICCF|nr:uncharacterized protein BN7_5809 [Wickerhamomyces ciferrii]CCH46218.1 hypothetical protein BN7_5809 [Wickerhamomyces ciferrii]
MTTSDINDLLKDTHLEQKSETEKTVLGPFPMEIWENIMQKGNIRKELFSKNKTFLNGLVPYDYGGGGSSIDHIHILLVVNYTGKKTEYRRKLYEFLDVYYDAPNRISDGKTLVISDFEEVMFLLNNLLKRPDSIIKKNICKSINVDISILRGYKELIYDSEVKPTLTRIANQFPWCSSSSLTRTIADDFFYGTYSPQLFKEGESRWRHPKLGISKNVDTDYCYTKGYNFHEMIHLSELFKSYDSGERIKLLKVSRHEGLQENHPYKKYVLSPDQFEQDPGFDGQQLKIDAVIASHNIKIPKRRSFTDLKTIFLIKLIVQRLSSVKKFHDTDVSIFISGMSDFQTTTEIRKSQRGKREALEDMCRYIPHFTLLNKPKSLI